MSPDLLQSLQVVAKFRVNTVSEDLRVLAINNVALSVEEPCWDLVLGWVLDDGNDAFEFFGGEFTGAGANVSWVQSRFWGILYRLFRSTSAFLQTRLL